MEYFKEQYNVPRPAEILAAKDPDPPRREDPPSYQEVSRVVSELKCGQASGVCGAPVKLFNTGRYSMMRWLGTIVWSIGAVPPDWIYRA